MKNKKWVWVFWVELVITFIVGLGGLVGAAGIYLGRADITLSSQFQSGLVAGVLVMLGSMSLYISLANLRDRIVAHFKHGEKNERS